MAPTIITGLSDESRCVCEEIFGPAVVVMPFDEENEIVGRANNNQYGLAACVWSRDGARAHRVANQLLVRAVL
jgi:acyl-CoA reductase-like NAD-dependent aldehyde dehydrogenase